MSDLLDDPQELGRRIGAARGYAGGTIEAFAGQIGVSEPTLRAYERGKLGDYGGSRELRRALAQKVRDASQAPPELLGLSEPGPGEVDLLRKEFEQKLVAQKNELRAEAAKEREVLEARLSSLENAA
jgi:transcriptional regulator with XRE-family HTH domain